MSPSGFLKLDFLFKLGWGSLRVTKTVPDLYTGMLIEELTSIDLVARVQGQTVSMPSVQGTVDRPFHTQSPPITLAVIVSVSLQRSLIVIPSSEFSSSFHHIYPTSSVARHHPNLTGSPLTPCSHHLTISPLPSGSPFLLSPLQLATTAHSSNLSPVTPPIPCPPNPLALSSLFSISSSLAHHDHPSWLSNLSTAPQGGLLGDWNPMG
eukprot:746179-Hanusia_phi.AAC.4